MRDAHGDLTRPATSGTFEALRGGVAVDDSDGDIDGFDNPARVRLQPRQHHRRLYHSASQSRMHRTSSPSLRRPRSAADSLASLAEELPPIGLESLSARSTAVSDSDEDDEPTRRPSPSSLAENEPSDNSM